MSNKKTTKIIRELREWLKNDWIDSETRQEYEEAIGYLDQVERITAELLAFEKMENKYK
jgi:hypothetical protein